MTDAIEPSLFGEIYNIPMKSIIKPLINMRENINEISLKELAVDIDRNGLISPILTYKAKGKYVIVAGLRRYLAFELLDRTEIPAIVRNEKTDDIIRLTFSENNQREDPSVIDEGRFLQAAIERLGLNQGECAKLVGKSNSYVSERIAISNYPAELLLALEEKLITFSVAREFVKITDEKTLRNYLRYATSSGMTPRTARQWVQDWKQSLEDTAHSTREDFVERGGEIVKERTVLYQCAICGDSYEIYDLEHLKVCGACMKLIDSVEPEQPAAVHKKS